MIREIGDVVLELHRKALAPVHQGCSHGSAMIATVGATMVFASSTLAIAAYSKGGRADFLALGLIGYALGGWLYSHVLTREALSAIGPITTIAGMLITVFAGRLLFAEPAYSSPQWIGFAFSVAGIVLISLGGGSAEG